MANLSLNTTVMITAVGSYCGQRTMNTFPHYVSAVPGVLLDQVSVFTALDTALKAGPGMWNAYVDPRPINSVHVETWYQAIRPVRYRKITIGASLSGGFTDTPGLTPNVQASIERHGDLANRHEVGGVRIPIGTDDSCFDDGELTPALLTALEILAAQMKATKTALGYTFKPLVGVQAPAYPISFVDGTIVQATVRVIRRRTVGKGI